MTRQALTSIENNFVGGLKTEFTGLNAPENSCSDADNCVFTLKGEVNRRLGIDHEVNNLLATFDRTNVAVSSYVWNNAGGDGNTRLFVRQIGNTLYFYSISSATTTLPLSNQILASTVTLSSFLPSGSTTSVDTIECQYTDGNGYLFVFHPSLDPFYCINNSGTITATRINIKIRDTVGIPEDVEDKFRPTTLSDTHRYNLYNQGWTNTTAWTAFSTTSFVVGSIVAGSDYAWTVAAGIPGVTVTDPVRIVASFSSNVNYSGTVVSYVGTTLTIHITDVHYAGYDTSTVSAWNITRTSNGLIDAWFTALNYYPSNADVWWYFKNSSDVFAPATTVTNVTLGGPAPKGSMILEAFDQNRATVSGITGLTEIITLVRPRTGCWFAGRVWYTGVDAVFQATGTAPTTSWTETIYFSQIIEKVDQFGKCYQINDPTSEQLFDLLPSDGGTVVIQGSGSIYKLFPIQNGLLVFASNGVWFVTGSQGIGFTSTDYTVTKISGVPSISATSFIDVLGYPVFWNEDGIYSVLPGQGGGLSVTNLALDSILSFYQDIPAQSKKYARGSYNPLTYIVQWIFKSGDETSITSRYEFDRILNFNTAKKSFYPWTLANSPYELHDCKYIQGAPGTPSVFKYSVSGFVASNQFFFSFAEERNTDLQDFDVSYESFFTTAPKLHGQALNKFSPVCYRFFSNGGQATSYKIQGIWDWAANGNSGRYTQQQTITNGLNNFSVVPRKHKIRGNGLSLQLKITSVGDLPFSFIGWSSFESANAQP